MSDAPSNIYDNPTHVPLVETISPDLAEKLAKDGWLVFELKGQTVAELLQRDQPYIRNESGIDLKQIGTLRARVGQVFVNPDAFFLPDGNGKSFAEQDEALKRFNENLQSRYGSDIIAVMGRFADHLAIADQPLPGGGKVGSLYTKLYARTEDRITQGNIIIGHTGHGERNNLFNGIGVSATPEAFNNLGVTIFLIPSAAK